MSDELDLLTNDDDVTETETTAGTEEPSKDVEEAPSASVEETQPDSVPMAALLDERRKRQALEAERDALIAAQYEAPARPDVFEDPDAAFAHTEQVVDNKLLAMKVELSRTMVEAAKPDYAEKEQVFMAMQKENPLLAREMLKSANPAQYAYDMAAKKLAMDELSDVDAYKAKLREEVLADLQKERGAVPSLSLATESGVSPQIAEYEDESLESITIGS